MDRNTKFYKIGPVVIEMQYKDVLPKVEPPQVTEFRIEYANNVNLSCQVSLENENNDEKDEKNGSVLFRYTDHNGLDIVRKKHNLIFNFPCDEISCVKKIIYDIESDQCNIFIDHDYHTKSLQNSPHLMETTQMQLVLIQYLCRHKGFLMHTNAICDNQGQAFCFTGHSGAGKTTLAKLFDKEGNKILTDETAIIWRDNNEDVFVSGTPWKGSNSHYYKNSICYLSHILTIDHGDRNKKVDLTMEEMTNLIAKQAFPPFWDNRSIITLMLSITKVLQHIDYGRFLFLPNSSAVDYLKQNVINTGR